MYKYLRLWIAIPLAALPLLAAEGQATNTDRFNFASGGIVRLDTSSGNLVVDAWDRPEVEITTTKSGDKRCLDQVHVKTDRPSSSELTMSTIAPSRKLLFWGCSVAVDQHVQVPRDTRLMLRHGAGYVMVSGVNGEIDADSHSGDLMLMLPDSNSYAIDAQARIGGVYSDFEGNRKGKDLVGERFAGADSAPMHRVKLRMGFGEITILKIPATPVAPMPSDAGQ